MNLQPVTLRGKHVELVPLQESLIEPLWAVAQHESIWRYMPFKADTFERFSGYLQHLLASQAKGLALPFVTTDAKSGDVIGATSYLEIVPANKRLEIGATWVTPQRQRSPVNTEAKLLQLTYAFETLEYNRVEFKTDSLNAKSRAALARIGAVEEGTFRNHVIMPDGRLRHSVWFSITREEWPTAKSNLESRLGL